MLVAADCPAAASIVPPRREGEPSVPALQYELLTGAPYRYDHEELIWEVHRRRGQVPMSDAAAAREELLRRSHPCLRASALPKRYGWGVHYDEAGGIALYGVETERYREFAAGLGQGGPTVVRAMRNKRA